MKLTDKLGNELQKADIVSFTTDQLVGVIAEIDSGEIARPVSMAGDKMTATQRPPIIVVKVQFDTGFMAGPDGVFSKLLKVQKPSSDVNKLVN